MKVMYISGEKHLVEVTAAELKKIKGDTDYTPAVGDEIDINKAWDAWLWICAKKSQILNAGTNLTTLANKLP